MKKVKIVAGVIFWKGLVLCVQRPKKKLHYISDKFEFPGGKIVLVENMDIQDPDFNSAFTIKTYSSEKSVSEETWGHNSIILRPNSYDSSYNNIIITDEDAAGMSVVVEFVKILKECKR